MFKTVPKPQSLLGYHRILSPSAGVRVSPLCLGAMNFGEAWKGALGECTKETAFGMLDFFYENGGNFIDTANNYQDEDSETWIGEWMQKHNNRDEIVLATKFSAGFKQPSSDNKIVANYQGNSLKSLKISVDHSLKKLQTTYIDLLYIHFWDFTTSIPELMNGLHNLVTAGKVLYLGISDTPAWLVVKCNDYARFHGLTQFAVYQGHWSAAMRDFERDIIPMVEAEGMGLAPWGAVGRGFFKPKAEFDSRTEGRKMGDQPEKFIKVAAVLEEIAKRKGNGTEITGVALAYVMHKAKYVFPIVGGRKVSHLKGNIDALGIELSPEEIDEIEAAVPFDIGFPLSMLFGYGGKQYNSRMTSSDIQFVKAATRLESVPKAPPIEPRQIEKKAIAEGWDA